MRRKYTAPVVLNSDQISKAAEPSSYVSYGLRTSGKAFRTHLASGLRELGWESSRGDPDIWFKRQKHTDGSEYMAYILTYVDDILYIHHSPNTVMDKIDKYFHMKPSSRGPPKTYLGGKLSQVKLNNGVVAWAFTSSKYIQESVRNVENYLQDNYGTKLPKVKTAIISGYRPELDISCELTDKEATYFMSLIGILRWTVELNHIDICTEVSILSSFLAAPREVTSNRPYIYLLT